MTMNQDILADPQSHPAVTEINMRYIADVAHDMAFELGRDGYAHAALEPDDGTHYELAIVRNNGLWGAPFFFASSFGCLYPWIGTPSVHPDHAREHYVANGNHWTATVYALFLNSVAEHWQAAPEEFSPKVFEWKVYDPHGVTRRSLTTLGTEEVGADESSEGDSTGGSGS